MHITSCPALVPQWRSRKPAHPHQHLLHLASEGPQLSRHSLTSYAEFSPDRSMIPQSVLLCHFLPLVPFFLSLFYFFFSCVRGRVQNSSLADRQNYQTTSSTATATTTEGEKKPKTKTPQKPVNTGNRATTERYK